MGGTEGTRGGREGGSYDVRHGRGEGEWKVGGTEGGKEGGGGRGGSNVMVGEGTRRRRERRREGESTGRDRGSKDATQARSVSGGREG